MKRAKASRARHEPTGFRECTRGKGARSANFFWEKHGRKKVKTAFKKGKLEFYFCKSKFIQFIRNENLAIPSNLPSLPRLFNLGYCNGFRCYAP